MKRIVFRISILGMIVALGLLAIAHAQRTVPDAPPDDGASNPLRNGSRSPRRAMDLRTIGPMRWGPSIRTCRRARIRSAAAAVRSDGGVQPAVRRRAARSGPDPDSSVADSEPAGGNAGNPGSTMRVSGVEPQLMPATADRYAVPARPVESQNPMRPPLQPLPSGAMRQVRAWPRPIPGTPIFPARSARPCRTMRQPELPRSPAAPANRAPSSLKAPKARRWSSRRSPRRRSRSGGRRCCESSCGTPARWRRARSRSTIRSPAARVCWAPRRPHRRVPRGELVWSLGTLKPGGGTSVEMQIMPTEEGEVGSVATVRFQADATARSIVTRPKLVVETSGATACWWATIRCSPSPYRIRAAAWPPAWCWPSTSPPD